MNWGGVSATVGLVALAIVTAPVGLVLLVGLYWIWRKS